MGLESFVLGGLVAAFLVHFIAHLKDHRARKDYEKRKYGAHWAENGGSGPLHWSEKQALEMEQRERNAAFRAYCAYLQRKRFGHRW